MVFHTISLDSGRLVRRTKTQPLETLSDAPDIFRVYRELLQQPSAKRKPGGWEYKGKFYPDYLTVGGACHAIFREALKYCKGSGIDIGAGLWPLPGAIPVDTWRGPGAAHEHRRNSAESQDFVFSSHCLEHNADWGRQTARVDLEGEARGKSFSCICPIPIAGSGKLGRRLWEAITKWTPTPAIIGRPLNRITAR